MEHRHCIAGSPGGRCVLSLVVLCLLFAGGSAARAQTAESRITITLTVNATSPADADADEDTTIVKAKFTTKEAIAAIRDVLNADPNDVLALVARREIDPDSDEPEGDILSQLVVLKNGTALDDSADGFATATVALPAGFAAGATSFAFGESREITSLKQLSHEGFSFEFGDSEENGAEATCVAVLNSAATRKLVVNAIDPDDDETGLLFTKRSAALRGRMRIATPAADPADDPVIVEGVVSGTIDADVEKILAEP